MLHTKTKNDTDLPQEQRLEEHVVHLTAEYVSHISPWFVAAWPSSIVQALTCTDCDDDHKQLFQ